MVLLVRYCHNGSASVSDIALCIHAPSICIAGGEGVYDTLEGGEGADDTLAGGKGVEAPVTAAVDGHKGPRQ